MSCPHLPDSGIGSSPCHPDIGLDPGRMGLLAVPVVPAALWLGEEASPDCVCREAEMMAVPWAAVVCRVPGPVSGVLDH